LLSDFNLAGYSRSDWIRQLDAVHLRLDFAWGHPLSGLFIAKISRGRNHFASSYGRDAWLPTILPSCGSSNLW